MARSAPGVPQWDQAPWSSAALTTYRLSGSTITIYSNVTTPSRHREEDGRRSGGADQMVSGQPAPDRPPLLFGETLLQRRSKERLFAPVRPAQENPEPSRRSPRPWSRATGLVLDRPLSTATVPRRRSCTASNTTVVARRTSLAGPALARGPALRSVVATLAGTAFSPFGDGSNSRRPRRLDPGPLPQRRPGGVDVSSQLKQLAVIGAQPVSERCPPWWRRRSRHRSTGTA